MLPGSRLGLLILKTELPEIDHQPETRQWRQSEVPEARRELLRTRRCALNSSCLSTGLFRERRQERHECGQAHNMLNMYGLHIDMALSTIICTVPKSILAWKHPESSISLGSQVIVNESQEALLFENGQLLTTLEPGRHLVESGNIPGLEGIISRAFNNGSPIIVEVWFVNKAATFDYKWGVGQIQVKDNLYHILISLSSYGSYSLRIGDPASFILQMVGSNTRFEAVELKKNLLPLVQRNLKDCIAEEVKEKKVDVFTLASELMEISQKVSGSLSNEFARFGIELVDFYISSLDVASDDPSFERIKKDLADAAGLRVRAKAAADVGEFYRLERSLDALDNAAKNEGGAAGTMLAGGLGLGMGVNAGQQMGQAVSNAASFNNQSKPQATSSSSVDQDDITVKLQKLKNLLDAGLITNDDYQEKKDALLKHL